MSYIEPSKMTVEKYLRDWLDTSIKGRWTENAYASYANTINNHLVPAFGTTLLHQLTAMQIEKYYKESTLHASTLRLHVKANGTTQDAALFAVALDAGVRKAELLGLQWKDLTGNTLRVERQLMKGGKHEPKYAPPKRGAIRSIDLSDETVHLLQAHRRSQAELKMKNRAVYKDYGLVFTQTWDIGSILGGPLHVSSLDSLLKRFCRASNVKAITPHGLRHTCATLLLAAGVPAHVVQRRLGHKRVEMTLPWWTSLTSSICFAIVGVS
jgi:integrase